jgi:hypothetical protein
VDPASRRASTFSSPTPVTSITAAWDDPLHVV